MTIVYTSNTGTTKKYAEMISAKTGTQCVELADANLPEGEEVIYLGWVMLGQIQGLAEARAKFGDFKAVCAVGMMGDSDKKTLEEKNAITEPLFTLMGGFDIKKLKGMHKMIMGMMLKAIKGQFKVAAATDPEAAKALAMFEDGFYMVDEKNLTPLYELLGVTAETENC